MNRAMIFIDYKNVVSSEYRVDIFQLPSAISDHLFNITGMEVDLVRTYVFLGGTIAQPQTNFIEKMVRSGFEVELGPQHNSHDKDHKSVEKGVDVALACRMLSLAHHNAYDTAILVSGDADILPAVQEVRRLGRRVMVTCFEDRISKLYREPTHETGSTDYEVFLLDSAIDAIAVQTVDSEISVDVIAKEISEELFDGNIDFDKIRTKRYITYWATRARYLQSMMDELTDEQQDAVRKAFEHLNQLSNDYRPGYIKALNRNWKPSASWEDEIKRIPRTW